MPRATLDHQSWCCADAVWQTETRWLRCFATAQNANAHKATCARALVGPQQKWQSAACVYICSLYHPASLIRFQMATRYGNNCSVMCECAEQARCLIWSMQTAPAVFFLPLLSWFGVFVYMFAHPRLLQCVNYPLCATSVSSRCASAHKQRDEVTQRLRRPQQFPH